MTHMIPEVIRKTVRHGSRYMKVHVKELPREAILCKGPAPDFECVR